MVVTCGAYHVVGSPLAVRMQDNLHGSYEPSSYKQTQNIDPSKCRNDFCVYKYVTERLRIMQNVMGTRIGWVMEGMSF